MKLNLPQQIEAERIILKKHTLDREYIQLLVDSINKSQQWLGRFLSHFKEPMTFKKEEAFIKKLLSDEKEINYGIWNKKTNELMGTIGAFNPDNPDDPKSIELGIMLFEQFAGQHYGPEATETFEKALFKNGVNSIVLKIQKENTRSRKAAEANGHIWNGKEMSPSRNHPDLQMLIYRKFSDLKKR